MESCLKPTSIGEEWTQWGDKASFTPIPHSPRSSMSLQGARRMCLDDCIGGWNEKHFRTGVNAMFISFHLQVCYRQDGWVE